MSFENSLPATLRKVPINVWIEALRLCASGRNDPRRIHIPRHGFYRQPDWNCQMNTPSTSVSTDAPASTSSLVSIVGGQAKTTSIIVAEKFVKLHKNVLQAIEKLDCSEGFRRRSYAPSSYIDEQGRPQPICEMTKDGFTFLVTSFRGRGGQVEGSLHRSLQPHGGRTTPALCASPGPRA